RVAVQGGGCSGFEYALGFDRGAQEGDHELEAHGVRVVVDPFSAPYLRGAQIDFLDGLQESGFKIENPNVVSACGCGHSFQVEDAELPVEVDMIERLPTPWGLVRLGVAPDHPKIKAVSRAFERIAAQPGFRF